MKRGHTESKILAIKKDNPGIGVSESNEIRADPNTKRKKENSTLTAEVETIEGPVEYLDENDTTVAKIPLNDDLNSNMTSQNGSKDNDDKAPETTQDGSKDDDNETIIISQNPDLEKGVEESTMRASPIPKLHDVKMNAEKNEEFNTTILVLQTNIKEDKQNNDEYISNSSDVKINKNTAELEVAENIDSNTVSNVEVRSKMQGGLQPLQHTQTVSTSRAGTSTTFKPLENQGTALKRPKRSAGRMWRKVPPRQINRAIVKPFFKPGV